MSTEIPCSSLLVASAITVTATENAGIVDSDIHICTAGAIQTGRLRFELAVIEQLRINTAGPVEAVAGTLGTTTSNPDLGIAADGQL